MVIIKKVVSSVKVRSNKEHIHSKPIFPMSRLEVPSVVANNSVKYNICMDEYDVVIEVKCSRNSMTEGTLEEEIGSDIHHYQTKDVYDKDKIIKNVDAFIKSYTKNYNNFNKNVDGILIEQKKAQSINWTFNKQIQGAKNNSFGNILDKFA